MNTRILFWFSFALGTPTAQQPAPDVSLSLHDVTHSSAWESITTPIATSLDIYDSLDLQNWSGLLNVNTRLATFELFDKFVRLTIRDSIQVRVPGVSIRQLERA
jgi:hypothetical protein